MTLCLTPALSIIYKWAVHITVNAPNLPKNRADLRLYLDLTSILMYNPEFHSFIAKKVARAQEIRDFLGFC